jgi:uncharacterized membrane protein
MTSNYIKIRRLTMKHKAAFLLIFAFLLSCISLPLWGEDINHEKNIDQVLEQIRQEQEVSRNSEIDPGMVSDILLAELGEAVMGLLHPDERQHEWMENMMGGEGSESLRSAHILMGYRYLTGRLAGNTGSRGWGMMGSRNKDWGWMPMMDPYNTRWGWGMHPFFFGPWGVVIIIGIAGIVLAIIAYIIVRKRKNREEHLRPIDILKTRLARGDISQEEFEKLKNHLV